MAVTFIDKGFSNWNNPITLTAAGEEHMVCLASIHTNGGIAVSVSFDGNAMTLIESAGSGAFRVYIYYYVVGTYTGNKNVTPACSGGSAVWNAAALYSEVDQLNPIKESETNTGTGTSLAVTFGAADPNGAIQTAKIGSVGINDIIDEAGFTNILQTASYEADYKVGVSAAQSCTYSGAGSMGRAIVAAALKSYIAISGGNPVAISPNFMFFKNFELPWQKKGGLWQPKNKGLALPEGATI